MLCKHKSVFVDVQESHWIFDNLGSESFQQTMISGAKGRILEDEFKDTSVTVPSLLLC
jgi:hypothetical protein